MSRDVQNDGRNELLQYLDRKLTDNRDFLKRRYLWLTPVLLKRSTDMADLFSRDLLLNGCSQLTDRETARLLFEIFIGTYSIGMSAADRIVQNKTTLTASVCRCISEEPIVITLQLFEQKFKDLGLDFGRMFDIYAGYQFVHAIESKDRQSFADNSTIIDDVQGHVKRFFGISFAVGSLAQHFADRVARSIQRLPKGLILAFAERNLLASALLIALDGFYLEQEKIDAEVVKFLKSM